MNSRIHTRCFGLLAITLPLAACGAQHNNSPTPTAHSTPIVTPSTTPAPQLVAGLPDFTQLVDQVGPGVVNIETVITRKKVGKRRGIPLDNDIPEFFRRFFGPDFQMPNQPRGGQDDEEVSLVGEWALASSFPKTATYSPTITSSLAQARSQSN